MKILFMAALAAFLLPSAHAQQQIETSQIKDGAVTFAKMGDVLDEDTMSSDSATDLATQQSIKAYVDANAGSSTTVSDTAEIDLTLTGDDIEADIVTGSIDETKLDASTNASLDLADSALQSGDNVSELTNDAGYFDASTDVSHDGTTGFVANEHIDWTGISAGTIHSTNYVDNDTTYTVGDGGLTTNDFTDADHTKLNGIEASADVTDTANVTAAGALMDSEVDADIKTLSLPASTTISAFGATVIDDATATAARTTLGVDAAGTDNSTAVTLAGEDYLSLSGQEITANAIDLDNLSATGTASASTFLRGDNTWAAPAGGGGGDLLAANNLSDVANASTSRSNLGVAIGSDVQAYSAVLAATTASYTTAEETKLSGVEALADVTDAVNVDAAGAVMNTDTSTASMSFVVDEDTMSSDSATKVPTQQSVKAYVDDSSEDSILAMSNTDTATDLSSSGSLTAAPIFGTTILSSSDFTVTSSTQITVNFTGVVEGSLDAYVTSAGVRASPQARFVVDGSAVGPYAATGYIRNTDSHTHASLHLAKVYMSVTSGDVINLGTRRGSSDTTAAYFGFSGSAQVSLRRVKQ